jgi:hypothetical protein
MIYILTRTTAFTCGDDPETKILCVGEKEQCEKKFNEEVKKQEKYTDFALILSKDKASWQERDTEIPGLNNTIVLKIHKVKADG